MGKKPAFGQVAPDGSDVCQLSHVCCDEQAGQAAHKALTRYSRWSSRLRNGCKQQLEQQSAAWAWHQEWRNFAGAAHFFSPSLEQPFCLTYHQYTTANTSYTGMPAQGHMHAPIVFPHVFTCWCGCAMGTSTGAPNIALYRSLRRLKTWLDEKFIF